MCGSMETKPSYPEFLRSVRISFTFDAPSPGNVAPLLSAL